MNDARYGLQIRELVKTFGDKTVVDDFTIDIAPGELVALLGPSGCGKTTTLRMIAGFLTPDRGTITVDGNDVTALGPEKRPSSMVFQNYALWPHLTVAKNVAYPLKVAKVRKAEIGERVAEVLELVGLSHHTNSRPAQISGGEQQRAALARALVQRPKLLLLDEPLSNLDARLRVRVREEIRDIQQRLGITTVLVTHDQEEALAVSDRVAVMNRGRIEQLAEPAELYRSPATEFVASFIGSSNFIAAMDLSHGKPGTTWLVRPEDVILGTEGMLGTVRRVLPHGHYWEVVVELGERELRAFVTGDVPTIGEQTRVTLRRGLRYVDGKLATTTRSEVTA